MTRKIGENAIETLKLPAKKEQEISMIFYFKTSREDVSKKIQEHQVNWIVDGLKEYPMPERKMLYEKILKKFRYEKK